MRRVRIVGKDRHSVWLHGATETIELKRTEVDVYGLP